MDQENINKVRLVYFSGTGGTKRIANSFEKEMIKRNLYVEVKNLGAGANDQSTVETDQNDFDLYMLLYPVYAFDAPKPIYRWIESLEGRNKGKRIAVISVSGGGEVWPNTGCRNNCCKKLEEKGLNVVYDNMMCMPANIMAKVNDHLAIYLIKIIPKKVNKALDDILSNKIKRTHLHKSVLRNLITNVENKNAKKFAEGFTITDDCKGCGWCAKNCPTSNIVINDRSSKPEFLDQCMVCMRCIYGCPMHAIKTKIGMVFKNGFDLDAVEKRMEGVELMPVEKCCKGIMFKGVKDYLLNKY